MPVRKRQTEKLTRAAPRFCPHRNVLGRRWPGLARRKKLVFCPFSRFSYGLLTGLTAFRNDYLPPQIHLQNRHLVNAAQLPYAAGPAESNRAPKQKSPPRRVPGGRKGGRPNAT